LGRNYLKGEMGDALHAILCGAGHNIRLILRRVRFFGLIYGNYCLGLECLPQSNNSCWQHKTEYLRKFGVFQGRLNCPLLATYSFKKLLNSK
jgi:IS5 family transposase